MSRLKRWQMVNQIRSMMMGNMRPDPDAEDLVMIPGAISIPKLHAIVDDERIPLPETLPFSPDGENLPYAWEDIVTWMGRLESDGYDRPTAELRVILMALGVVDAEQARQILWRPALTPTAPVLPQPEIQHKDIIAIDSDIPEPAKTMVDYRISRMLAAVAGHEFMSIRDEFRSWMREDFAHMDDQRRVMSVFIFMKWVEMLKHERNKKNKKQEYAIAFCLYDAIDAFGDLYKGVNPKSFCDVNRGSAMDVADYF